MRSDSAVDIHVSFQIAFLIKCLLTNIAVKLFISVVNCTEMCIESTFPGKTFLTNITSKRLVTAVDIQMSLQSSFSSERLLADVTTKWLLTTVNTDMRCQTRFLLKTLLTNMAAKRPLTTTGMKTHMRRQITFPFESFLTNVTTEWFIITVNTAVR
eukprot:631906_1